MANKEVSKSLAAESEEPEEEEYYAQYVFENCTFNITMAENSQLNIGTGKPQPYPPPQ